MGSAVLESAANDNVLNLSWLFW